MTDEHQTGLVHGADHADDVHIPSDTVNMLGREITVPGGEYTVTFGALAVLTVAEVAVAELPDGALHVPVLLVLSIAKIALVVWFYMHLKYENKILGLALLVPVLMLLVIAFFLMAVPAGY